VISLTQAEYYPIFCWNLPIFVAMATRVGLTKIWMTQCDWPTPKIPVRCENPRPILNVSWFIVNFVWKFSNFCYHGNRSCLTQISLTQLNRPTPKIPYLVQESWWYLLHKLSNGRFYVQMTSACCHDNKDGLTEIWMIPLDCPTPKTLSLVQTSWTYLYWCLSYGCSKLS